MFVHVCNGKLFFRVHTQDDGLLPRGDPVDQFKPVVPWPHVEGVEVDLNSIRLKHHGEALAA